MSAKTMQRVDTIEQRLTALESVVAELRRMLLAPSQDVDWVKRITGSFENEPAFDEVLEYGRAIRKADIATEDDGP